MEFAARDYFLALQFFQKEEQDLIWGKSSVKDANR